MNDDPQPGEVPETEIELFLTILNDERDERKNLTPASMRLSEIPVPEDHF